MADVPVISTEMPPVEEIARRIVARFDPRRVILFGSRARGDQGAESDVDLFVEMETEATPPRRAMSR